ncbi:MAG: ABC transporter permease [Symbiobacterium sp.]|uniref:ABC transporter permease n=1 Tax=Symbiobacterium sp. TaxID=1971213 RepID=UPI003464E1BF
MRSGLNRLLILALLLALWEGYVRAAGVSPLLVPAPSRVLQGFGEYLRDGSLLRYAGQTLRIVLGGMGIGLLVAFGLTALATASRWGRDLLLTLTAIMNPLPAIALLPLALLWLGIGTRSLLFVIANSVVWAVALNMHTGFETVPVAWKRAGQNLGLQGWGLIRHVYLPAALPYILTGLKIAWSFGWRTVIAAELVFGASGQAGGLGWMINVERYNLNTTGVFCGLVTIIVMGLLAEFLFAALENRTIRRWGMSAG